MPHLRIPGMLLAAVALLAAAPVRAEDAPRAPFSLAQLFGSRSDDSELVARMGRLENQIRQLTGMIEELQHRNQQLEQQIQRMQQDTEFRFQEMGSGRPAGPRGQTGAPAAGPAVAARPAPGAALPAPTPPPALPPVAAAPGRRGDAFDPSTAPNAPGVPRPLGTIPGGPTAGAITAAPGPSEPRGPGSPLDLSPPAGPGDAGAGQPPPGVGPAVGAQAALPPSGSAKDEYDLAYGAILRRDYELADASLRRFLANHPRDRLAPEAYYWLGETQYLRQRHNDAAETFLDFYNKYPNSLRAPEALLRLGQSLVALGKQEAACASFGAALAKYPKASANVKRAVEQEQKRARC